MTTSTIDLHSKLNERWRSWIPHFQCLGVALTAGIVAAFFFSPRFSYWKGIVLPPGAPIESDYGRALATFYQIDDPWAPIVIPMHRIIAWRLLFPMTWHYLHLPKWLFLAMPHVGCFLSLWLVAWLTRKRFGNWGYTWLAVALVAALPWFFVSTGWLGYFDSWFVLGILAVSFVPSRLALTCACLLTPWIDERFILALPVCVLVRIAILYDVDHPSWRKLFGDIGAISVASIVYLAIRAVAFFRGDTLAPNYLAAHWEELHSVPWMQFLDGLWSGYRTSWLAIFAAIYFWWRRAGWLWGLGMVLVVVASAVGPLLIAADMSRSTTIILPTMILGLYLWNEAKPQTFQLALKVMLVANLLLPAAHVMWNKRIPIYYFYAMRDVDPPVILDPETYLQHAQAFIGEGKQREAGVAIETALKLNRRFAPAYILRAVYRGGQGDLANAKVDIQEALAINPESADALFVSAQFAQALHDPDTAKSQVDKALRNAPVDWPQRVEAQKLQQQLNVMTER